MLLNKQSFLTIWKKKKYLSWLSKSLKNKITEKESKCDCAISWIFGKEG